MSKEPIIIRNAKVTDVPEMSRIVTHWAEEGLMLHRSMAEFYEQIKNFMVAVRGDQVLGLTGLRVMWSNLAEVYGLALSQEARGQGIGGRLVEAVVEEARNLGIRQVFALTYEQAFFERCGFEVVDRMALPMKVWSECSRCPKRLACDEIAVIKIHEEIPDRAPVATEIPKYEVPIINVRVRKSEHS